MSQPVEIVHVDRARAGKAVATLVAAFRDRPPLSLYYPVAAEQDRVAPGLMTLAVYPGIRYGEVHATAPDFAGVAVWMPSEAYPVGLWRLLRATPLRVVVAFGRSHGYRLQRLGRYIDAVHGCLAPFEHVYLQSLGVGPVFQARTPAGAPAGRTPAAQGAQQPRGDLPPPGVPTRTRTPALHVARPCAAIPGALQRRAQPLLPGGLCRPRRHLLSAHQYHETRTLRFQQWREAARLAPAV
ncbi:MAG: hypothetical protein ACRDI2_21695 [Chloroflexota bacterium]